MTSTFKKITPDLMVTEVASTVKFYTEKLGFKLDMVVPDDVRRIETQLVDGKDYAYALVSRDKQFLMFMRKDVYEDDIPALKEVAIGASATFYCEVENLTSFYHACCENQVEIIKDMAATWYGMNEFYIRDCNGYILGFGESAAIAK